ncbi:MAG: hypothetical protein H0W89_07185 [Candidatus Levybacteria bacterium]|nr:hypothetical protein [Candidatus Levybacteria bacterium]
MSRSPERPPLPDLATAFDNAIARRGRELDRLSEGFRRGMDLVANLGRVNEALAQSARPELVITERVKVKQIYTFEDVESLNNFTPRFRSFGVPIFKEEPASWDPSVTTLRTLGYRDFTEEERTQAFFIGARGDREEHIAFAEANGIDRTFATDLRDNSHVRLEAFMRMSLVMPDFTHELLDACLERPNGKHFRKIEEELFIAYSLMSSLVDRKDNRALQKDGTIEYGLLCI